MSGFLSWLETPPELGSVISSIFLPVSFFPSSPFGTVCVEAPWSTFPLGALISSPTLFCLNQLSAKTQDYILYGLPSYFAILLIFIGNGSGESMPLL